MMAHIAKLTNMVVATENEEEAESGMEWYKLVFNLLFNMSYIQIINKMWLNERTNITNTTMHD
jgi:hypothetical protein